MRLISLVLAIFSLANVSIGEELTVLDPDSPVSNAAPFGVAGRVGSSGRYQQAFDKSSFGNSPILIEEIDFFRVISGPLHRANYSIAFSTISGIDSLSRSDFDSNVGADNQHFTSINLSGNAPQVLEINGEPFMYNPNEGDLLLDITTSDIRFLDGFPVAQFASSTGAIGTVSRTGTEFGNGFQGWGLATRFTFTSIPEPNSNIMALIFFTAAIRARR